MPKISRYGLWNSPISIDSLFRQPSVPAYPTRHLGQLYWLQALPDEGGRIALMQLQQGKSVCLTPEEFNIRSRVHEYGGKCFCLLGDSIIFNNFTDSRLYRQVLEPSAVPQPITAIDESCCGFVDLVPLDDGKHILAVAEHSAPQAENQNRIVAVNVTQSLSEVWGLISGSDFYASPVVSPIGNQIAWLEWDHPNMPWDCTRLCRGEIVFEKELVVCKKVETVIDNEYSSVCQPGYLDDGSLVYVRDGNDNDWWNLYRQDGDNTDRLTNEDAEFGEAHWQFGQQRWVQIGQNTIAAIATNHLGDRLLQIDVTGVCESLLLIEEAAICHLYYDDAKLLCVLMPEDHPGEVVEISLLDGISTILGPQSSPLLADGHSVPNPIVCSTSDGERTWGYFYEPYNPKYSAPQDDVPPLVVMVHGGPTGRSNRSFHPLRQYFTSLGFAVFDTNHRGSTGYGRSYRQRLLGGWGEIDCMDIADTVQYLIEANKVAVDAVFIRGGSAGGYAVLRALTKFPHLFSGGACYYGIGNLITLSEITHKFEARYTEKLIGELYDPAVAQSADSRYVTRSPIFEMEQLNSPLIIFQGLLDNVVPVEVSREVVTILEKEGVPYEYSEYEGEGHGFRKMETRIDSLEKETRFFQGIIEKSPTS
ncbi:MAG: alpha/beta hydrolase family protein [bacterium]